MVELPVKFQEFTAPCKTKNGDKTYNRLADVSTRAVMISRGREDMDFRGQDAVR